MRYIQHVTKAYDELIGEAVEKAKRRLAAKKERAVAKENKTAKSVG